MLNPDTRRPQDSEMRQAFIRHMPERTATIETDWLTLCNEGWDPKRFSRLLQRIEDLAGSAGRFGLIQVSENALSMELYFSAYLDTQSPPSTRQIEEVNGLIATLKAVSAEQKRPLADTLLRPLSQQPRIYYLRFNETIAPGLVGALESLQCEAIRFHRTDDLLAELTRQEPSAILIDGQMLPNVKPLRDKIESLKQDKLSRVPIAILSSSSDLNTRLQAMRAGAEAFFVTPIDATEVANRIKQMASSEASRPFRVLVVDDDPSQANFASSVLRRANMDTCIITDPLQVLNTLDSFRPDLVLMDIYMPGADGMELTSIIREQEEFVGIPIVFLSGEQNTDKQLDALSVGGDDFIAKPIRPRHLIATVKNRIQRIQALDGQHASRSRRDPATGLFNRPHFFERLEGMIATAISQSPSGGIMHFELDRMESIRQDMDSGQSDALLAEIGRLIAGQLEPQDIAARLDTDSFAVIAKRPLNRDLVEIGEKILTAISSHRFHGEKRVVQVTASAGLCFFDNALDTADLVARARKLSLQVAAQGGGTLLVFEPAGMDAGFESREHYVLKLLQEHLQKDVFQVIFQPVINTRDHAAETYQMLPRLRSAAGDQVPSSEFMVIAQGIGLATEIDRWMAKQALDVLDERHQTGDPIRLLIQQSQASIGDPELIPWIQDALRQRQLVGTGLVMEFNLVDMASHLRKAKSLIVALQDLGVEVSLARFGYNDASFKVLQFLRANYIKVVDKLLNADPRIIGTLVKKAHELGVKVILPEVSGPRPTSQHWLSGADFIQGNFIQRQDEAARTGLTSTATN